MRDVGLLFSILTAAVVVSMVKIVGALLVTALLVTPAATAQFVGRVFVPAFFDAIFWFDFDDCRDILRSRNRSSKWCNDCFNCRHNFCIVATFQIVIKPSSEA